MARGSMADYWLDADTFITPKNGPYAFVLAPGFWEFLDEASITGLVRSSRIVYGELVDESDDDLAAWARERRTSGLWVEPSESVQETFTEVADFVHDSYDASFAADFLDGADPWLIAHAVVDGGEIVTFEKSAPAGKKVKIPDVAADFSIACRDIYSMLRQLGASFR